MQQNQDLHEMISIFYNENQTINEIYAAAEKIIVFIYKNQLKNISVNKLRYEIFMSLTVRSKKQISLALLPPSDSALREHVKRVYYQIQSWLGRSLNPEDWGWKRSNSLMLPVMNNKPVAPAHLLEQVCKI